MSDQFLNGPLIFGEVLFDRFPDGEEVLGGAPFNVAWNLQALGMPPLLVSRVGEDELGRRIRSAMNDWGMTISGVQSDGEHETGTVTVMLEDGEPRFRIETERAYDFIAAEKMPVAHHARLLYHGSLALRMEASRRALVSLKSRADMPVFVDVNLRDPWWDRAGVLGWLHSARWAKLNESELDELAIDGAGREERITRLLSDSSLDVLILTLGPGGAEAHGKDGWKYRVEPAGKLTITDTVGAGDAFSSVVILGLGRGWGWPIIMERAQQFAAAVLGLRGATTDRREFYESFAVQWETS